MMSVKVFACRRRQQTLHASDSPLQLKESARFLSLALGRAWKLQSDLGLRIICLHLQKLELFSAAAIVTRRDKKEGQDIAPCSCAYRTALQNTSKVQQPSRRHKRAVKNSDRLLVSPTPSHWQHSPLNAYNTSSWTEDVNELVAIKSALSACARISVGVIITLHLRRSRMDNQSLDGGKISVLIGSYSKTKTVVLCCISAAQIEEYKTECR